MRKDSLNNKLALGLALGLIFGACIKNIPLGLGVGLAFGSISDKRDK